MRFYTRFVYSWDGLLSVNRATERIGGGGGRGGWGGAQGKYRMWDPKILIVGGGSGGPAPGNFEILHALKCVLGAPEAVFHAAHSTYIPASCHLQLAVSVQKV